MYIQINPPFRPTPRNAWNKDKLMQYGVGQTSLFSFGPESPLTAPSNEDEKFKAPEVESSEDKENGHSEPAVDDPELEPVKKGQQRLF